jgi:acetylornithine deacetylase/succinyl-diaminopimelate desuccinylase-like protein
MKSAPDFNWKDAEGEATALLQSLMRVDTTNPPGDEIKAAKVLAASLKEDGIESELIESAPGRANLIARLESNVATPPLLMAGHLDVVPAGDLSRWTHPPFGGVLADGMIWGRGAIDMKNMVAMSAMVIKLLRRHDVPLRRDIILAAVADEEQGCNFGSRFLVEKHPEKVRAGWGLGEVGGFPTMAGKARIMPVQTAEKGVCWFRLKTRGTPGHGSMPRPDSAVIKLAVALKKLGETPLPMHVMPVVDNFIRSVARLQPIPDRFVLPQILNPRLSRIILERVFPDKERGKLFATLMRNTVSPTVLRAGQKTNVIPDVASVEIDGRLVPGQTSAQLFAEVRQVVGNDVELEVINEAPGVVNEPAESELLNHIRRAVKFSHPDLPVVPYMIPGFTDGAYFSRLGARWYGFSPVWLRPELGLNFADLFHGFDERIPEDGYHWGLRTLHRVVQGFAGK